MSGTPILLWYRSDLRLADHPALTAAVAEGRPVVPVYVLDDAAAGRWAPGGASRWWLHHSLAALARDLAQHSARLILRCGDAAGQLRQLAEETGAGSVYFTRRYEPWAIEQEKNVKAALDGDGIEVRRFGGGLLAEPEKIKTQSGDPYRVYTPFWRALSSTFELQRPFNRPSGIAPPRSWPRSDVLEDWRLLPRKPNWAEGFARVWTPGEAGAEKALDQFLKGPVAGYAEDRNRPDMESTSRLSPHLAHGEISPRRIWWRTASLRDAAEPAHDSGFQTFLKEVAWREFSYHLLFHFPHLPEQPFRPEFAAFPWRRDEGALQAWQKGRTGFPIVDAGMRQLWATGWMHNRVRMIVASFLIKDLLVPWQQGEAWFWDTLVDADLANNAASWQWVAGSGADAAPYFRVFNPTTQGAKFDPEGTYVRRWVPELEAVPADAVHEPAAATEETLRRAGLVLGKDYPAPIVDHRAARERALAAFERLKT